MRSSIASIVLRSIPLLCTLALVFGSVPAGAFAAEEPESAASPAEEPSASPIDDLATDEGVDAVVAQATSSASFLLARTLESTHVVPVVTANLPLDADAWEDDGLTEVESAPSPSTVIGSFETGGLVYAFEPGGESVALVAVDLRKLPSDAVEAGTLVVPSAASPDGADAFTVSRIAARAFSALRVDALEPTATAFAKGEEASEGQDASGISVVGIPASVASIDEDSFAGADMVRYIAVSEDNPCYSMYDGVLYDAECTRLLLVPEGRQGAVRIASSAESIAEGAFSHCASLSAFFVDAGSAAFSSRNGLLYDAEGTTLLRAPAGAEDIIVSLDATAVDDHAFDDCENLERIMVQNENVATLLGPYANEVVIANDLQDDSEIDLGEPWEQIGLFDISNLNASTSDIDSIVTSLDDPDERVSLGSNVFGSTTSGHHLSVNFNISSGGRPCWMYAMQRTQNTWDRVSTPSTEDRYAAITSSSFSIYVQPYVQVSVERNCLVFSETTTSGTLKAGGEIQIVSFGSDCTSLRYEYRHHASPDVYDFESSSDPLYIDDLLGESFFYIYVYGAVSDYSPTSNVKFDCNGGSTTDPVSLPSVTNGTKVTAPVVSLDGWTFGGWYVSSSFAGSPAIADNGGTSPSISANTIYYAKWVRDISFHPSGGDWSGPVIVEGVKDPGDAMTASFITSAGPPRDDWLFAGWAPSAADDATALVGENVAQSGVADTDYYARWKTTASFDTQITGSTIPDTTVLSSFAAADFSGSLVLPEPPDQSAWPAHTGFAGWSVTVGDAFVGGVGEPSGLHAAGSTVSIAGGPVVFTAVWAQDTYRFDLVDNGFGLNGDDLAVDGATVALGTLSPYGGQKLDEGVNAQFKAMAPARTGYDLVGFAYHPGQSDETLFYVSDSPYVMAGPVDATVNDAWWTLPCFDEAGSDGTLVPRRDVVLEAVWQPIEYTITWDYNWDPSPDAYVYEENGAPANALVATVKYGAPVEVPVIFDPGCTFVGWKAGSDPADAVAAYRKVSYSDGSVDPHAEVYSSTYFAQSGSMVLFKPTNAAIDRSTVRFFAHFAADEPTLYEYRLYLSRPGQPAHGSFMALGPSIGTDENGQRYYTDVYEFGSGVDLNALCADGTVIAWDDGYTLLGFTDDPTSTGTGIVAPDKGATGLQVYYAVWAADAFSVTLVLDTIEVEGANGIERVAPSGAQVNGADAYAYVFDYDIVVTDDGLMDPFFVPTGAEGYRFCGWQRCDETGALLDGAPLIQGLASAKAYLDELYAQGLAQKNRRAIYGAVWEPMSYNVYFHMNRASTSDERVMISVAFGSEVTLPHPATTNPGNIFRVWQLNTGLYLSRFANWRPEVSIPVEEMVRAYTAVKKEEPQLDAETADGSLRIDLYANWTYPVSSDVPLSVGILLDPWSPQASSGLGKVITNDSGINGGEALDLGSGVLANAWVGTDKDYTDGSFDDGNAYDLRIESLTFLPAGSDPSELTTREVFTRTESDGSETDDSSRFALQVYGGGKRVGDASNLLSIPLSSGRLEFSRSDLSAFGMDAIIRAGDPLYLYYDLDLGTVTSLEKYQRLMEILDKTELRADQKTHRVSHPIAHLYYTIGLTPR